jgi:hypothetical protein
MRGLEAVAGFLNVSGEQRSKIGPNVAENL